MTRKYEMYVINKDYDDHTLLVTNDLNYAHMRRRLHIDSGSPVTVNKQEVDEDGFVVTTKTIIFTGKPGIDRWEYWTDSHGRPAKRFVCSVIQGEF